MLLRTFERRVMKNPLVESCDPPGRGVGWRTWSPFQSVAVRNICAQMRARELSTVVCRGMLYGGWCAVSLAMPLQLLGWGLVAKRLDAVVAIASAGLIVVHVACIPVWRG